MKKNLDTSFQALPKHPKSSLSRGYRRLKDTALFQQVYGFTCMHCHALVNSDPIMSGVNNRNHCPYCLSSKHVDLFRAGDRLNACKGSMSAIGLAWKKSRNKYGSKFGELMIIHLCVECGAQSINRIAADDDADKLYKLFELSISMDDTLMEELQNKGICMLQRQHQFEFEQSLFGSIKSGIGNKFLEK